MGIEIALQASVALYHVLSLSLHQPCRLWMAEKVNGVSEPSTLLRLIQCTIISFLILLSETEVLVCKVRQ